MKQRNTEKNRWITESATNWSLELLSYPHSGQQHFFLPVPIKVTNLSGRRFNLS
jgi:hypothetical protein